MTLRRKREIVRRFWAGESVMALAMRYTSDTILRTSPIEAVIRDYMNGIFQLKSRKRCVGKAGPRLPDMPKNEAASL